MTDAIHFAPLIDAVVRAIEAGRSETKSPPQAGNPTPMGQSEHAGPMSMDDLPAKVRDAVLAMIDPLNADLTRNHTKAALWRGEWQEHYPSQSEADLALCGYLARLGLSFHEVDQTFRASGLYREKWERADYRQRVFDLCFSQPDVSQGGESVGAAVTTEPEDTFDIKNGRLFADQWRDKLLYLHETGVWMRFDAAAGWDVCAPCEHDSAAKKVVSKLRLEAADLYVSNPESKATKRLMAHVDYSSKERSIKAMQNMAKSEPGMTTSISEFDADPFLLGMANGVLDLRIGKVLAPSPRIFVSKRCSVAFDPQADCPRFMSYLQQVQPDTLIQKLLQRFAGYCLTGLVGEKKFLMFIGGGDNGKTIFIEIMSWILGAYAQKIETESLMEHKRSPQGPSPDIVALKGKRFVFANETGEGQRLADARVKDLTGGDTLTGRAPYGTSAITFQPTHKLVVVGNHRPTIGDTSSGMWGRVGLVPFDVVIPLEQRDRQLLEKLKAEGQGILNWMLAGCAEYQSQGLCIPAQVEAATQAYRDEQDIVGEWRQEHCIEGVSLTCNRNEVYQAYKQWAFAGGYHALAQARFTRRLTAGGVRSLPDKRSFGGIALNASGQAAALRSKTY